MSKKYAKVSFESFIVNRGELYIGDKSIKNGINYCILKIYDELFNNVFDNFIDGKGNELLNISYDENTKMYTMINSCDLPIEVLNDGVNYNIDGLTSNEKFVLPYILLNKQHASSKFDDEDRLYSGLNGIAYKFIKIFFRDYAINVVYNDKVYVETRPDEYKIVENVNNLPNLFSIKFIIDESKTKSIYNTHSLFEKRYDELILCLYYANKLPNNTIFNSKKYIYDSSIYNKYMEKYYSKHLFCLESYLIDGDSKDNKFLLFCFLGKNSSFCLLNTIKILDSNVLNIVNDALIKKIDSNNEYNINLPSYLYYIVIGNFYNMKFSAQDKTKLLNIYKPSSDFLDKVKKIDTSLFDPIMNSYIRKKYNKKLKDINNKVTLEYRPSSLKSNATLILCEGYSALANIERSIIPKTRKNIGILALQGKIRNPRKNKKSAIDDDVMVYLSKILNYDIFDSNSAKLKYSNIIIMCDMDSDGIHISMLVLNAIDVLFKNLINSVYIMRLPIIIADNKEYFDESNIPNSKNVIYFKGLSSYETNDMKNYFLNLSKYLFKLSTDEDSLILLNKCFEHDSSFRKLLYNSKYEYRDIWATNNLFIKDYIKHEYIKYIKASLKRSIPSILDGLTSSLRKIVYVMMGKSIKQRFQLSNFCSEVSSVTHYHHRTKSLEESCKSLGFNTKNIKLIKTYGNYGSIKYKHYDCGESAYIHLSKPLYYESLFRNESMKNFYRYNYDEGCKIEPTFLLPIIPLILVNGSRNVSTGYNSHIPSHNIYNIISYQKDYLKSKIENINTSISFPEIKFDFYKNSISILDKKNYLSKASIKDVSNSTCNVRELTLTKSFKDLKDFLKEKNITSEDNSTDDNNLDITCNCSASILSSFETEHHYININVFDENEVLLEIKNVSDLYDIWFTIRLKYIKLEIEYTIEQLKDNYEKLHQKYVIINEYIVRHITKENERKEVFGKYKERIYIEEITVENLNSIRNQLAEIEKTINYYKDLNPYIYWLDLTEKFDVEYRNYFSDK